MTHPATLAAEDPVLDMDRLAEIADLDVFSAEATARLDEYARRAAQRLGAPIGLVTIVLDGAQLLAGRHGLTGWLADAPGTPVEWSLCATTVRTREQYVVPDTSTDAVQQDNPLVTEEGLAAYAGTPLITSRGHVVGAHCVIGTAPREFSATELEQLAQMADEVVAEIESWRTSTRSSSAG
jgi:GAF domain-containing protein